ncbi:MAG: hypothetical protein A3K19_11930 [Lentisphaerae bacterium RIFOXYB12_FULL_65_16]|nr:MAG: hypothetical protein A3K18_27090 [Lentisphaerae bacterium RIFOXYA12_64_32]OGV87968.1 MAG: hypothetical protein A3K19_11930 [Lentisphaerae bacterium RIFOXYB12_FULL_65_16]
MKQMRLHFSLRVVPVMVLTVAVWLCCAGNSVRAAGGLDERLKPGIALLEQGKFADAYATFSALFEQDPGSAQVNFYLGLAAYGLGDYENASLAFERTLMIDPNMQRARVELARSYLKLGVAQTAKSYFEDALKARPPENVERNIERVIAQIDASGKRNFFSGSLSLGINYDTNVAASPNSSQITTPGLLVPSVRVDGEDADFFESSLLQAEHRYRINDSELGWRSALTLYNASYFHEHDQNLEYVRLATGPSLVQSRRLIDVMLVGEYLTKESDSYLNAFGGQLRLAQALWGRHILAADITAMSKEYDQAPDRKAYNLGLSAGPVFVWGKNQLVTRVGLDMEDARDGEGGVEEDELSYTRYWTQIRYERELPFGIAAYAGYRFQYVDYKSDYAVFAEDRQDEIHDVLVGVRKKLPHGLAVDLNNTYTEARSEIDLYEYNRNLTSLSLQWSF